MQIVNEPDLEHVPHANSGDNYRTDSLGYNPELTGMEEKFSNIWHEWHNYLVAWTRDRAPKLLVILVLAFIFVRLLGLITRKLIALREKSSPMARCARNRSVPLRAWSAAWAFF